jgi:hypothetical protein
MKLLNTVNPHIAVIDLSLEENICVLLYCINTDLDLKYYFKYLKYFDIHSK